MSPEDIRQVVDAAIRDAMGFPWWSYPAAFLLSVLSAYLGAYFVKKGEDRATRENYESLREQLRRTTQDTEEIKNTLSRKSWLTQQQWEIRERHYMALLTHLRKLQLTLLDREAHYLQPGSEHNQTIEQGEHFQALTQAGYKSYQEVRELIGPASVFLSATAIDSLEALVRKHWDIAEFSACTAEYVTDALKLVEAAHTAVLKEARSELGASAA